MSDLAFADDLTINENPRRGIFIFTLFILFREPARERDEKRRGARDGGEGAGDHADEHYEGEIARRFRAEVDEGEEREHDGERGVNGAGHCLVDRLPYRFFK